MLNFRRLISLLRPKQWIKNSFVFAPLIFSGQFLSADAVCGAIWAGALFCVASSVVYILNDINDIDKDRLHPRKRLTRPLAAGTVSPSGAYVLMFLLLMLLFAGLIYHGEVLYVILGYMGLNVAYTFFLKNYAVVDVFSIALGFVLRVYAGAAALSVPVSGWMFVSTLCLALFLASIKRRQELILSGSGGRKALEKYSVDLVDRYAEMSAMGALVFYGMFVMAAKPALIVSVPIVLFGLFRYWYIVDRLGGGESPTDVVYSDRILLFTLVIWVATCVAGLWPR